MASRSSSRNKKPVVIAGGGIGGLAAALALARKRFKSIVLEQAAQFGEIGAGIQIAPNAWHALDALGVGQLVKKEAVFIERLLMMDGISGEKVIDIPLDARFAKRFANPYAVTHRADIHGSLVDGCKALPELIELRTNSRVTGYDLEDAGVSITLANGERIHGAALVGADGARSIVRDRIVGDAFPNSSIHKCYRAVLNAGDVPKDLRWAAATLWAAHNTHIVHYPLRGWKLFNLVATTIGKEVSEGHNEVATPQEVLPQFAHYCGKPLKLMRTPKQFTRWILRYRDPVDRWTQGRVALLGDAAHLMLQYMAQGAAMAMEDAVALGVACDTAGGDFEKAFKRYEEMRVVRASRVHISANSLIGQIFHVPDGIERRVRNQIFLGRKPERYYDALEWVFAAPDYVREFKRSKKSRSKR
ncbi:MAG TPA: 3-hydroxybenzoate 6-monooxygenase [Burkholderiales bacterium]|nr:3-hydroxybenzoate 6-monooxygenase [Burkholderiales bacterium]